MRLHDLVDQIDLPPTHVTDGAWDAASGRVRRRRAIDVASATAHPVPRPAEAAGASDDSLWRDANGIVWFGIFEDHNTIATSKDGGATWTSHSFGSGYFVPTYSGAKDVLAVLEYEDVNRQRLRLLWVWYSIDGGATRAWHITGHWKGRS